MAITFDPPVQINPDVPDPQKWAFVNQNFLSLGNAVKAESDAIQTIIQSTTLYISSFGTVTITVPAATYAHGATMGTTTVAHSLGYPPATVVYVQCPNFGVIGANLTVNTPGYTYIDTGTNIFPGTVAFTSVDSSNVTFRVVNLYTSSTLGSSFDWTFTYYVLAQNAT